MEQQIVWNILGIEPTKDETVLKSRYHDLLREVNPEDDPEGFKRLREAYETAIEWARKPEEVQEGDNKTKDEIDLWLDRVNDVYWYADTRNDIERWKELFEDTVCVALDTALEVRERFLVYLMSHVYIDQNIWKLIDKEFNIIADKQELSEVFPRDFLDYIQYQVENQNFLAYELLEVRGLDESEISIDTYISQYLKIKSEIDRQETANKWKELDDLKAFEVYHPYEDVERIRLNIQEEKPEEALVLAKRLLDEYPDDVYVGYWAGQAYWMGEQWDEAYRCWNHVVEYLPEHYTARVGIARYYMKVEKNVEAKELIMELLENNGRDDSVLEMMQMVNIPLMEYYHALAKQEPEEKKHSIEACWCMFQNEMFEETLKELEELDIQPDDNLYYDYVNMKGRCYMGLDQPEPAIEYLLKWEESRRNLADDGTEKYQKRKAREGFIQCAIGIAYMQLKQFDNAEVYLRKGIPLEKDLAARCSFMDRLAVVYYKTNQFEKCIDTCSHIVDAEPGYFPAYIKRQQAYFELQNGQGVVDDYYNAIHIFSGYYKPYLMAVKVFCIYRQYADARKALEAAKENGVEHEMLDFYEVRVLRNLASSEEEEKRVMELCIQLKEKLKGQELKENADSELSEVELLERDMCKDGMPEEKVDLSELAFEEILLCMDLGQTDHAYEMTMQEIKSGNENYRLHWIKADIHRMRQEFQEALTEYDYLLTLMPEHPEFLYFRGVCLTRLNEDENAISAFRATLEADPEHPRANHELMKIYSRRYDRYELKTAYGAAIKAINAQLALVPDAYYYIERGLLYMDNYNIELALQDYRKALELEPENIFAYNNIGFAFRVQGKYKEAIAYFEKSISLMKDEKTVLPYTNMAKCYEAMGQTEKGISILLEAKKLFTPNLSMYRNLAELYCITGDFQAARDAYEEAFQHKYLDTFQYYDELSKIYMLELDFKGIRNIFGRWSSEAKQQKGNTRYTWKVRQTSIERIGKYYLYHRELKQAIKYLEEALQLAQQHGLSCVDSCEALAKAYRLSGKKDKARVIATQALQYIFAERSVPVELTKGESEDPTTEEYMLSHRPLAPYRYVDLAEMYWCIGDEQKANQYIELAFQLPRCRHCSFGACYEVYNVKAYLAEGNGDMSTAIQMYRKAHQINPSDWEAVLTLEALEHR